MGNTKNAKLIIDGDATDARQELARLGRGFEKLENKISKTGKAGAKSGGQVAPLGKVVGRIAAQAVGIGSVAAAITKVVSEITVLNEIGRNTTKSMGDVANLFTNAKGTKAQTKARFDEAKKAVAMMAGLGISAEGAWSSLFQTISANGADSMTSLNLAINDSVTALSRQSVGINTSLEDVTIGTLEKGKAITGVRAAGFQQSGLKTLAKTEAIAQNSTLNSDQVASILPEIASAATGVASFDEMGAIAAVISNSKGIKGKEQTKEKTLQFLKEVVRNAREKFPRELKAAGINPETLQGVQVVEWAAKNIDDVKMRNKMSKAFGSQSDIVSSLATSWKTGGFQSNLASIKEAETMNMVEKKNELDDLMGPAAKAMRKSIIAKAAESHANAALAMRSTLSVTAEKDAISAGVTAAGDGSFIRGTARLATPLTPAGLPADTTGITDSDETRQKFVEGYKNAGEEKYIQSLNMAADMSNRTADSLNKLNSTMERNKPR